MLESVEIRWFYKGSLPNKLFHIFDKSDVQPNFESRSDYYLLIENCDNIGIKLRNSRLELKWRKNNNHSILHNRNIIGRLNMG